MTAKEFYDRFKIRRNNIGYDLFLQTLVVAALTSYFAKRYGHGAIMALCSSNRPVRKFIGKGIRHLPGTSLRGENMKIMLAAGLSAFDGGGCIVDGELVCLSKMMEAGGKYKKKAAKRLNYKNGIHTRHISSAAFSLRYRNTLVFVTSSKGRCCIMMGGMVLGRISRLHSLNGPVYIQVCNTICFPEKDRRRGAKVYSQVINQVENRYDRVRDMFNSYRAKVEREMRVEMKRQALLAYKRRKNLSSNSLYESIIRFLTPNGKGTGENDQNKSVAFEQRSGEDVGIYDRKPLTVERTPAPTMMYAARGKNGRSKGDNEDFQTSLTEFPRKRSRTVPLKDCLKNIGNGKTAGVCRRRGPIPDHHKQRKGRKGKKKKKDE